MRSSRDFSDSTIRGALAAMPAELTFGSSLMLTPNVNATPMTFDPGTICKIPFGFWIFEQG